jgi:hypothetical protein
MTKRAIAVVLASLATLASLAFATSASADEKTGPDGGKGSGAHTLKVTTIYGRQAKPSVVVEVSKAKPEIKLADLQDPAVEKIIRAGTKAPF